MLPVYSGTKSRKMRVFVTRKTSIGSKDSMNGAHHILGLNFDWIPGYVISPGKW